jgi:hypothetical protein
MRRTPQLAEWLGNSFYLSVSLSKMGAVHRNIEGPAIATLINRDPSFPLSCRSCRGEQASDLRREPIEKCKALLAKLLKGSHLSIVLNDISMRMARSSIARHADLAARVSCQSGLARRIAPVAHRIG